MLFLYCSPSGGSGGYIRCKCAHRPWSLKIRCPPTTFEVNTCGPGVLTPETVCCRERSDRDGDGTKAKGSKSSMPKDHWIYKMDRQIQGENHPDYVKPKVEKPKLKPNIGDDFVGPKKPKTFLEVMRKQYYEDEQKRTGRRRTPILPELPAKPGYTGKIDEKNWIYWMQKMHDTDQAAIAEKKRTTFPSDSAKPKGRNTGRFVNVKDDDGKRTSKKKGWRYWVTKLRRGRFVMLT